MLVRKLAVAALTFMLLTSSSMAANVRITEFMSEGQGDTASGNGGRRQREFFEVTNLGDSAVDITGWTYNDNNPNDPVAIGAEFGTIAAGESVIVTQMAPADFRSYWGLSNTVRVATIGGLSNLGNADTINLYNSATQNAATLEDTLTYTADARGSGVSRNRPYDGGTGQYLNTAWINSTAGDSFASFLAPNPVGFPPTFPNAADYIDLANPGTYVPEPTSFGLLLTAATLTLSRRRRKVQH